MAKVMPLNRAKDNNNKGLQTYFVSLKIRKPDESYTKISIPGKMKCNTVF